ncbi:MAG: hypothetical protein NUW37_00270 [Planctomycetes bacterium]|nr:hypothetical protein [Planctomycetota bacterium]
MSRAEDFYKKGADALKRGQIDLCVKTLLMSLKVDPNHEGCRQLLRAAGQKKGGGKKGGFLGFGGKSVPLKAQLAQSRKKWSDVDYECESELAANPDNTAALKASGEALIELGAFKSASVQFETAMALDPTNIDVMLTYGKALEGRGDLLKAREVYGRARKADPNNREAASAYKNIEGRISLENDGWQAGSKALDMVKDKDQARDLEQKTKIIKNEDHRLSQIREMKTELDGGPGDRVVLRDLWQLQRDAKDWKGALESLAKLQKLEPDQFEYTENEADVRMQYYEERIAANKEKADAGDDDAAAKMAEDQVKLVKFQIKEYSRRADHYPNDLALKFNVAKYTIIDGDYDKAVSFLQHARKDAIFGFKAEVSLGILFYLKSRFSMAVKQFAKVREGLEGTLDEKGKEVTYWHARSLYQNGETDSARDLVETLYMEDESFKNIADLMNTIESGEGLDDSDVEGQLRALLGVR